MDLKHRFRAGGVDGWLPVAAEQQSAVESAVAFGIEVEAQIGMAAVTLGVYVQIEYPLLRRDRAPCLEIDLVVGQECLQAGVFHQFVAPLL